MNFWSVEVKKGESLKVIPGDGIIVHISQAVLGETKTGKGTEPVCLFVNINEKKLVLGTLSAERLPQVTVDLVFEKEFELTHNWKHGSVFFYGYKANNPFDEEIESEEEQAAKPKEEKPVEVEKSNAAKKKESGSGKPKVTIVEPSKESSDEDGDSSMSEDSTDDDLSGDSTEDDSEDESESEESDEETPQKVEVSKKRATESASKTPVADKKAKVTPQKIDGKKVSGHVATPHPAKKTAKTPASSNPSQQTPKSAGTHTCSSCNKGFGSDKALESHTKAKHGGN